MDLQLLQETLRFSYEAGDVTEVWNPHTTGWRRLPGVTSAQIVGGEVELSLQDRSIIPLHDGDAFLLPPELYHRVDMVTPGSMVSRWAHFTITVFDVVNLMDLLETPMVLTGDQSQRLGDFFAALAERPQGGFPLAAIARRKRLEYELVEFITTISALRPDAEEMVRAFHRLSPVLRFLRRNLAEPVSVEDLAAMASLSESGFHAVFKKALGQPPKEYLTHLRMRQARTLLLASDMAVTEIAHRTGYSDPFHFSKMFKKETGSSPQHFREQVLRGL